MEQCIVKGDVTCRAVFAASPLKERCRASNGVLGTVYAKNA